MAKKGGTDMTRKYSTNTTHMPTGKSGKSEAKAPHRLLGGDRGVHHGGKEMHPHSVYGDAGHSKRGRQSSKHTKTRT